MCLQVEDRFYIYLEYVHPGSINKYVREHCGAITESVIRNFTRHILSGLAYLHSKKTIHRYSPMLGMLHASLSLKPEDRYLFNYFCLLVENYYFFFPYLFIHFGFGPLVIFVFLSLYAYRDIKGANLLVDSAGVVKLADFGMAKHVSSKSPRLYNILFLVSFLMPWRQWFSHFIDSLYF